MKKLLKLITSRAFLVLFVLFLDIVVLSVLMFVFQEITPLWKTIMIVVRLLAALLILNSKSNPAYKIAWLLPIVIAPTFGGVFYIMLGGNKPSRRKRKKIQRIVWQMRQNLPTLQQYAPLLRHLYQENPDAAMQSRFIAHNAFCPPYGDTETEFLPSGEIKFKRLKEELQKAKHYIFLEYFILEEGVMWNEILAILEAKVKAGVDVRVIYDDFGCINKKLHRHYDQVLRSKGIQCCVFNRFRPILSAELNNRDHRKIVVIDGHTGITGGINLADEYINIGSKFGHWKDASILLHGEGVWSLTVMFLSMWGYLTDRDEMYEQYRPSVYQEGIIRTNGIVQPYNDSPWDEKAVGENVYLNMITRATKYVYITTPYLILSNEMVAALQNAAQSGVDVRIITPHIPDKRIVFEVTRANYDQLVRWGVKIYEYTPGFVHEKLFVCDDLFATVGTINLDYRSLYLHFECGVWMYRTTAVKHIYQDYLHTLESCQQITVEQIKHTPLYKRLIRSVLTAFSPMM